MTREDLNFVNENSKRQFEISKLSVSSNNLSNKNDVEQEIKDFSPIDGWISLQSTPAERIKNSSFDTKGENILAGEFLNSQNQSLSVRFTGDDWLFVTTCEKEEGEELIKTSSKQLSKLGEKIFLNYNVFYKVDSKLGCRPYVSAFTGFSEGEK